MREWCETHVDPAGGSYRKGFCPWCDIDRLTAELAEAREECNLWNAENGNAQTSISIPLDRIVSLEKEKYEAIRMAQAAVTCSRDWQTKVEEWEIEYNKVNTVRNEQDAIIDRYRVALERIARMDDSVYSKGSFCSKIAREALGEGEVCGQ